MNASQPAPARGETFRQRRHTDLWLVLATPLARSQYIAKVCISEHYSFASIANGVRRDSATDTAYPRLRPPS